MQKQKLQTLKGFRDFLPIKTSKKTKTGIFIDDANLFYIQKELGWKIDWEKFVTQLRSEFNVSFIRYYLGMPRRGKSKINNLNLQKLLESSGYIVVTKPLKKIYLNKSKNKFKYKCNFDVEIALDVATFISQLDFVIIVSSDSDFIAVRNFVLLKQKQFLFMCFEKNMPWEIRRSKFLLLEKVKKLIKLK